MAGRLGMTENTLPCYHLPRRTSAVNLDALAQRRLGRVVQAVHIFQFKDNAHIRADTNKKTFLILDNLQVHRAKTVREWAEKHNTQIELFFLPSYCPELNPDEYLNNTVKTQLRNHPAPRTQDQLQGRLRSRMKSNQRRPQLIRSLFKHPHVQYAAA